MLPVPIIINTTTRRATDRLLLSDMQAPYIRQIFPLTSSNAVIRHHVSSLRVILCVTAVRHGEVDDWPYGNNTILQRVRSSGRAQTVSERKA